MADAQPCSVCSLNPGAAGSMQCGHRFCHDCYTRYVDGSVAELRTHLRCCLCGWLNVLGTETRDDDMPLNDFGRNREPRLQDPVGMCQRHTTDFVITDAKLKRVFIFDRRGSALRDFAHLHNCRAMRGTAVNHEDRILVPLASDKHRLLAFYTIEGTFLQSAYLPPSCDVAGVVVTSGNQIVVADAEGGCIHILDEHNRMGRSVALPQLPGESHRPRPGGIAINSLDQLYVTDSANHCIKVFDGIDIKFLFRFAEGGGERAGRLCEPTGIATDDADRVLVADTGNQRVQLFTRRGDFLCFVVRYNSGDNVYVAPTDVTSMSNYGAAVLLRGTKDAYAGETRIYEYESTLRKMNYHNELTDFKYSCE